MRSSSISIYTRLEDKNMDERDIVLNSVLEELKNKKLITELEKDIISAIKVFLEQPIDRNNVKTKINEIDLKYNTYSDLLMVMPQDSLCTLDELNDVANGILSNGIHPHLSLSPDNNLLLSFCLCNLSTLLFIM